MNGGILAVRASSQAMYSGAPRVSLRGIGKVLFRKNGSFEPFYYFAVGIHLSYITTKLESDE